MNSKNAKSGKIVICPTPIGNLGDVTERCVQALQNANVVFAEDTRVSGKLLAALGIKNRLERLDEEMMSSRANSVIERAKSGEVVAYCSDAGMPGVSDPGLRLVAMAKRAGVSVEVLPGASALTCAYVASGFTCPRFYFHGFFPRKAGERQRLLEQLAILDACLIFYESPKRLVSALQAIKCALPHRLVSVARELTKLHEEVVSAGASEVYETFLQREKLESIKGEIVIVVDASNEEEQEQKNESAKQNAEARVCELKEQGMRNSNIAKTISHEFGISRNDAYDIVLKA